MEAELDCVAVLLPSLEVLMLTEIVTLIDMLPLPLSEYDIDVDADWLLEPVTDLECPLGESLYVAEIVFDEDFMSDAEFVLELFTSLKRECDTEWLVDGLAREDEYSEDTEGVSDSVDSRELVLDKETDGVTDLL